MYQFLLHQTIDFAPALAPAPAGPVHKPHFPHPPFIHTVALNSGSEDRHVYRQGRSIEI